MSFSGENQEYGRGGSSGDRGGGGSGTSSGGGSFSNSPAKKKQKVSNGGSFSSRGVSRGKPRPEGNPDWPCLIPGCEGHLSKVDNKYGGFFLACDKGFFPDPQNEGCKFTATLFASRGGSGPAMTDKLCQICCEPLDCTPSIGFPMYPETSCGDGSDGVKPQAWENLHAHWKFCAGRREDGHFKFNIQSTKDWSNKCSESSFLHCPQSVSKGDLIVRAWEDTPLHARCAKGLHERKVTEYLLKKNFLTDRATTNASTASDPEETPPPASIRPEDEDI